MRLLHTSDLHFGLTLGGFSLLREQREWVEQLVTLVREQEIDGVLFAGDLFDRAVAAGEAIALYDELMTRLCMDCGAEAFVIAGNHDGAARLSSLRTLLAGAGFHVQGSLTERPTPLPFGDAEIWLIPYFHPQQVRLLYPEREIPNYSAAMETLMDDVRARRDRSKRTVVVAHCFVTGAALSESDNGAMLGGAQQVAAQVFHDVDYVALGHLHRPQSPAENVHYSGSPYPYSFAEGEKQMLLYDTATGAVTALPLTPSRTLRQIKGRYADILTAAEQDAHRDDYLKIELTDSAAGLEKLETLRALYPALVTLLGKRSAGGEAESLTVEKLEAMQPEELLRRFCEEIGGEPPEPENVQRFLQAMAQTQEGGRYT